MINPADWGPPLSEARARAPRSRPLVTAAFALSADGYLTSARGQPTAISCLDALKVTHALRGAHDAILVGRGTQQADDPLLTTRYAEGPTGLRVVLDTNLELSPTARVVTSAPRPVVVMTSTSAPAARELLLRGAQVDVERLPATEAGVSLAAVLTLLLRRGISSVMVEGGATVLESFFSEGLVDFICLTRAPLHLAGPSALPCGGATRAALASWRPLVTRSFGTDLVLAGPFASPAGEVAC